MKTDHILQRALDFWRNAGCKDRPIHIQEFQQFLSKIHVVKKGIEQPLSPNYIKQIFNKLRVVFKRAIVLEIIEENPVDTIGKIKLSVLK